VLGFYEMLDGWRGGELAGSTILGWVLLLFASRAGRGLCGTGRLGPGDGGRTLAALSFGTLSED
jgi:hypothetical protein